MTDTSQQPGQKPERSAERVFYAWLVARARGGVEITATTAELAEAAGIAYSRAVGFMQALERDGWIARRRIKHKPTVIRLLEAVNAIDPLSQRNVAVAPSPTVDEQQQQHSSQPTSSPDVQKPVAPEQPNSAQGESSPNDLGVAQSSKFKVQSSKFKVQPEKQQISVRTESIVNQASSMQAAADLNFELLADFRRRVLAVIYEFGIAGRKRQVLCDAIVALAAKHFTAERAEEILADLRRAQESTAARQRAGLVWSLPAVGICILEEYAETGQMVLFDLPPVESADDAAKKRAERERKQAERQQARGKSFRRPQVTYTDEERRQKEDALRKRHAAQGATS